MFAFKRACAAFAMGLVSLSATAAVGQADWQSQGDGLLTVDSASGLAWLDITQTAGMSLQDVTTGALIAQGFRVATSQEFEALALHAYNDDTPFFAWLGAEPAAPEVSAWMGGPTMVFRAAVADLIADQQAKLLTAYQTVDTTLPIEGAPLSEYEPSVGGEPPARLPVANLGTFYRLSSTNVAWGWRETGVSVLLVRELAPVPEASTVLMMGLGLVGIVSVKRRRLGR